MPDVPVQCPSCGAPRTDNEKTCRYCGTRVDGPPPPPPPPAVVPGLEALKEKQKKQNQKLTRGSGAAGCLVAFALIAVIGGAIVALLVVVSGGGGTAGIPKIGGGNKRVHPSEHAVLLPTDGAGAPDAVAIAQTFDGSESGVALTYVEGASGKLRWTFALDRSKGREAQATGDGQTIYVLDGTAAVIALDRRTGAERWRAQAAFPAPPVCDLCVALSGGRFIVVGADGTVQAFDVSNGAQVWTNRLPEAPRILHVVPGGVATLTKLSNTPRGDPGVAILAAEAGARRDIPLSCPDPNNPRSTPNTPSPSDPLVAIDGGANLLAYFRECAVRVDVAAGTASIVASMKREVAPSSVGIGRFEDQPGLVVDGTNLLLGSGNVVVAVPLSGGGAPVKRFEFDRRYEISPITMREGRLVVTASPDFARDRPEVWGIDLADTSTPVNPVWRRPVLADAATDEWRARSTPPGVALIQCDDDKDECKFATLAVPDGRELGTSTGGDLFTTAFLELTQDDRYSWYTVGTKMFLVEHATARLVWDVGGD